MPIPFFGELGSVNPVFVTRAAAEARGPEIATQAVASFTLGVGQFCTKPGVLLVPEGSSVVEALRTADLPGAAPMLSERMVSGHNRVRHELEELPHVSVLARSADSEDGTPGPTVLLTDVASLLADLEELFRECFGPTLLVATYTGEADLLALAQAIDGQLTASVFGEDSDVAELGELVAVLATRAGRLLWNGWPTGVSVTYAQQHGGPYPATTAPSTTSVGTAAIDRFLRPVAYQGFPQALLPAELRDELDDGHDLPTARGRRPDAREAVRCEGEPGLLRGRLAHRGDAHPRHHRRGGRHPGREHGGTSALVHGEQTTSCARC